MWAWTGLGTVKSRGQGHALAPQSGGTRGIGAIVRGPTPCITLGSTLGIILVIIPARGTTTTPTNPTALTPSVEELGEGVGSLPATPGKGMVLVPVVTPLRTVGLGISPRARHPSYAGT